MEPKNSQRRRSTILVIDDDKLILHLIEASCRKALGDAVDIVVCGDATEGLERLDAGGIDVVLTDLEMPGATGLDVLAAARRRNAVTQVIMVTGRSHHETLLAAMEGGAADYLLKPIDTRLVGEVVQEALRRGDRWRHTLAATWHERSRMSRELIIPRS